MIKSNKIAFYTCLFGKYDSINAIDQRLKKKFDFFLITDETIKKPKYWKVIKIKKKNKSLFLSSRFFKIFPNQIAVLKNYTYSIYFDANIEIKYPIIKLVNQFIQSKRCLGLFKHPERDDIYQEGEKNISLKNIKKIDFQKQLNFYDKQKYRSKNDLTENCIIFRKHNDKKLLNTMKIWWNITSKFCKRDQLSLPYARWKAKIKVLIFSANLRTKNLYANIYPHSNNSILRICKIIFLKKEKNNFFLQKLLKIYIYFKYLFLQGVNSK
jgi:hypothetical protein